VRVSTREENGKKKKRYEGRRRELEKISLKRKIYTLM
jgi:hypothetical protein